GYPPIFNEKIRDKAYNVGESCTLKATVVASPNPLITWFRNDELLSEGGRVKIEKDVGRGKYSLTILQTKPNDFGVYKCVARNKYGTVTCRARMLCGSQPSRPGRPHVTQVSDKEVFMIWESPESDGNSYIQAYKVDWFRPGDHRWTTATYSIDECVIVKNLKPETSYRFRISAINQFGQSPYSWASVEIKTKKKGTCSLNIDEETKKILLRSRQAATRPSPEHTPPPCASNQPIAKLHTNSKSSESARGQFSLLMNAELNIPGCTSKQIVVKITEYNKLSPGECLREYDMLKMVNQERITQMVAAFVWKECIVLAFEKLYGENVVRSLSFKNKYDEHTVTTIIKQVLDGVQYLHHRGIVHLNISPNNVIMQSRRRFDIKLTDFSLAHKVTTSSGEFVERVGAPEFMAPEKVCNEKVGVAADVWGVAVLSFILVSGVSPFYSDGNEETYNSVKHVRYDVHSLYHNVTKHCLRFIYQTLRRSPKSRLNVEECLEHKWLMLHHSIIKMKKASIFPTDKLKYYLEDYNSKFIIIY
ncbi:hypothetical protein HELRODRAFT_71319, partial [Helobdella robusta]|uniref:Uncharacterized protein n=1 Tax=Helobdella robusta TaxID=6412 RepID=T1G0J5_HELRO